MQGFNDCEPERAKSWPKNRIKSSPSRPIDGYVVSPSRVPLRFSFLESLSEKSLGQRKLPAPECARPRAQQRANISGHGVFRRGPSLHLAAPEDGRTPPPNFQTGSERLRAKCKRLGAKNERGKTRPFASQRPNHFMALHPTQASPCPLPKTKAANACCSYPNRLHRASALTVSATGHPESGWIPTHLHLVHQLWIVCRAHLAIVASCTAKIPIT